MHTNTQDKPAVDGATAVGTSTNPAQRDGGQGHPPRRGTSSLWPWLSAALSLAAATAYAAPGVGESWLVSSLLVASAAAALVLTRRTNDLTAATGDRSVSAREERLAVVTHDLRAPLAGIIGLSDLLLDSKLDRSQRELSSRIRGSAGDLIRLSDDVLDLTRLETGRLHLDPAPFAVRSLLHESLETVRAKANDRGIELTFDAAETVPERLIGDGFRIRQILINLLTNAIKFTADGSVSIHADWTHRDDRDLLCVEVRDTGIGIPRARQAAIFERYAQAERSTQRRFGGTGLGLSICAELCALMRGEMTVRSKEGKGSTFRMELPLPKLWEDDETWISRRQRAVLVDPCALGRRHLINSLALLDVEVIERPTLSSALEFLREALQLGDVPELVLVHRSVLRGHEEPTAEAIATEPALRHVMRLIVRGRDDDDALPLGFSAAIRRPTDLASLKSALGISGPIATPPARKHRRRPSSRPSSDRPASSVEIRSSATRPARTTDRSKAAQGQAPGQAPAPTTSSDPSPLRDPQGNTRGSTQGNTRGNTRGSNTKSKEPRKEPRKESREEPRKESRKEPRRARSQSSAQNLQSMTRQPGEGTGPEVRVLAADDDPVQQTVLRHMMRRCEVYAKITDSGTDAIARYAEDRFDVVVLDARMPDLDGFDTARKIRALHADVRASVAPPTIVLLTAHHADAVRGQADAAGVDIVLQKPLDYKQLSQILRRAKPPTETAARSSESE